MRRLPRVAVGVSSGEMARYAAFCDSLIHVQGVTSTNVIWAKGANIAQNRNNIGEQAVNHGCDYIWYVDDDQIFHPQTLHRLMTHNLDIVSGMYLSREPPFIPHIYEKADNALGWWPRVLKKGQGGLVECVAAGAGCLLVKTNVLRKMEKPWWRLGQHDKVNWSDDCDFCARAIQAGFKIHVDMDCTVGHQLNVSIWPVKKPDGNWNTTMVYNHWSQQQQMLAEFPPAQAVEDV